jgi:hypothetical protein
MWKNLVSYLMNVAICCLFPSDKKVEEDLPSSFHLTFPVRKTVQGRSI